SSTVNPVGVLAAWPSGVTVTLGVNGSRLQPSMPIGSPRLSLNVYSNGCTNAPSFSHESAVIVVRTGPVQEVGSVSSGGGVACSVGEHGNAFACGARQFQPLTESWRLSPGTPQNVTLLEMKPATSVMFGTSTVTP